MWRPWNSVFGDPIFLWWLSLTLEPRELPWIGCDQRVFWFTETCNLARIMRWGISIPLVYSEHIQHVVQVILNALWSIYVIIHIVIWMHLCAFSTLAVHFYAWNPVFCDFSSSVLFSIYTYTYIHTLYIYICLYSYIYIHIYIQFWQFDVVESDTFYISITSINILQLQFFSSFICTSQITFSLKRVLYTSIVHSYTVDFGGWWKTKLFGRH